MPKKLREPKNFGDQKIGQMMAEIRNEKSRSQEDVAGSMKIKSGKLRNLERGKQMPTIHELAKFCLAVGASDDQKYKLFDTVVDTMNELSTLTASKIQQQPIFNFAQRLSLVEWYPVSPVIDIKDDESRIWCTVTEPKPFRFAAPEDTEAIIAEVITEADKIPPDSVSAYSARLKFYTDRLQEGNFAQNDEFIIDKDSPTFDIFKRLISDTEELEKTKIAVQKDYLTKSKGFHFNGPFLALTKLQRSRRIHDDKEEETLDIRLQETDYYSYRIATALSDRIQHVYGLRDQLTKGLSEYAARGVQRHIHLSFGLSVIVHTLEDNRVIITRRSENAANPAGEANNYFMSANEGLTRKDFRPDERSIRIARSVERAIEEEIAGRDKHAPEIINKIQRCAITGATLYLPNLSVNLCFYVSINCSSKDIRDAYYYARDSQFETVNVIYEQQWHDKTGLPAFNYHSIYRFIDETIRDKKPHEAWDEGALMALILSTLAL